MRGQLDVPNGWAHATLGDTLLAVVGGGTPSRKVPAYFDGPIPWFTVKDMKAVKPSDAEEHISQEAIADSATNLVPANTLIVATRIALGRAIRPTVACAINQDLKALIVGTGIDTNFLLYWVGANERAIQDLGSGTTVSGIRLETLHALPLLLPPSPEQTRIVEKLEELLSALDAGVTELKAAQKKLAQYRQSLLKAAVEGALTAAWRAKNKPTETGEQVLQRTLVQRRARWEAKQLAKFKEQGKTPPKDWQNKYPEPVPPDTTDLPEVPEGWVWASVDQLSFVVRGASPRPAGDPRFFGGEIPWITVGSLTADNSMYLKSVNQFVTEAGRDASRFIEAGTLLLTNSGATLGVPKITNIGGCINDGSVALLDIDEPLKVYLYWYLRTQTDVLRATNQGAAQPNLNIDIVKRISVPICPLAEMGQVNDLLGSQTDAIEEQRQSIAISFKQSTAQRQNILKAAFSGQLVPQDPNDEPASVLLERIRAERLVRASSCNNTHSAARTGRKPKC